LHTGIWRDRLLAQAGGFKGLILADVEAQPRDPRVVDLEYKPERAFD
jgi:hypothetical protein